MIVFVEAIVVIVIAVVAGVLHPIAPPCPPRLDGHLLSTIHNILYDTFI